MNRRLKRYWKQLLADRRKLTVLLSLFCVGLLLWGRLLLNRPVPRTAVAEPDAVAAGAPGTGPDARAAQRQLRSPAASDNVTLIPAYGPTARDLFAFHPDHYNRIERERSDENETVEESQNAAKLAADRADERRRQEARNRAIRAEAESLTLQSTLVGQTTRALINGRLYATGEQVNGFEIVAIGPRTVTLRKQDVQVTLEM